MSNLEEFDKRFSFGEAVEYLRAGHRLTRESWASSRIYVRGDTIKTQGEELSRLILSTDGNRGHLSWHPSAGDVFATDWRLVCWY